MFKVYITEIQLRIFKLNKLIESFPNNVKLMSIKSMA